MHEKLYIEASEYEERKVVFDDADAGKRLDAALAERFPDLSRTRIQSIIENGLISPPGFTKKTKVKAGDAVAVTVNERIPLKAAPEDIEIDVVYEDGDVLVVDKKRGMVVHPAKGNVSGTLVNALLGRYALSSLNGDVRPGIVHRIDKDTSGLLVVAKNDAAHSALADQFAAHSVTRSYNAVVAGGFREEAGTIDSPIGRDPGNRLKQAVVKEGGRRAVTHWRVAGRLEGRYGVFTLLELRLETGRTHQIRVHMASIGHPVLGDSLYGPARGPAAREGQFLHAGTLGFDHPKTGKRLLFESPLPDYFTAILARLR